MRPFEICFLLSNVPALVLLCGPRRDWPAWTALFTVLPVILAGVHLVLEGYRWQMIPAYVVTGCVVLLGAWSAILPIDLPTAIGWAGLFLLAAAFGLGTIWPVIGFPKPTGPFAVGTVVRHLVDANRRETLSPDQLGARELMVQIWYPADSSAGKRAAYVLDRGQISSFFDAHRALVKTDAVLHADLSKAHATYPVVIYSPSWHGQRNQNTFLVQELASHGFVVVAIDHPYGSATTVFPDGRIARAKLTGFWDVSSDQALQQSLRESDEQLQIRVRDVQFVLDELTRNNRHDRDALLGGRLDLDRVGIFGFSFGGTVAAQACLVDSRFKAGFDLDGSLMGKAAEAGIPVPFFFLNDDTQPPTAEELMSANLPRRRFAQLIDRDIHLQQTSLEKYGGYRASLRHSKHNNFSDTPLFSPLPFLTGSGAIAPERALRATGQYVLAFFEKYLQGEEMVLLDGPSRNFPEVKFESFPVSQDRQNAGAILSKESPHLVLR